MFNGISGRIGVFAALLLSAVVFTHVPAFAQTQAVPSENASEAEMKAFAERERDALNNVVRGTGFSTAGEASVLCTHMRDPDGDWQNGSAYLINVRESVSIEGLQTQEPPGNFQVVSHGKYMESLYGHYIGNIALIMRRAKPWEPSPRWRRMIQPERLYAGSTRRARGGGTERWACAAAHETPGAYGDIKYVVIAGFDHDENDSAIVRNRCARNALISRQLLPVYSATDCRLYHNFVIALAMIGKMQQ